VESKQSELRTRQTPGSQLDVLANAGPMLVEAVLEQFTPPMPANVMPSQAAKFAAA
jgi:pyruvate dehydrogenase (quinone)